ncbi:hypothetical protein P7C71_g6475, partial [Lecanoromycetidae sp. Uapishka_2]
MAIATLPQASAVTSLIASHSPHTVHAAHHLNLALQVLHNLQYQHDWTTLRIHKYSPLTKGPLPRPLISGLPPHRIYVHPDDQVDELKRGVKDGEGNVEREWVLPTHLKEKWSLRRFAEVFDAVGEEPPMDEATDTDRDDLAIEFQETPPEDEKNSTKRRGGKRLLLATVGDDSTVVYYIMHDGIVKPRQN